MHAKTHLVPATCNDSICVQVHVSAFCARHRPLLLHRGAKVLFTTQWKIQFFPPCRCLVSPKAGLSAQGLQGGGIVPLTFEPWVQGGSAGCWDPLRWCGVLEGCGWWQSATAAPCFPLTTFQKSQCLEEGWNPKAHFSPLCWQQPFLGEFTPHQCCLFPQESCLQLCFSVILPLACVPAEHDFPYILYLECNSRK